MTATPPTEAEPRTFDLRGIAITELLPQAEVAMTAAAEGAVRVLTDQEVVVKYVTPTAATRGLRCRFGPPKDGVWRIDLSPREPRPERPADAADGNGGNG
ncbi:MAG: hypothetical protein AMXMBFR23_20410 [Chloroflexota bacterium]